MAITISIVITTYNRARLLENTLGQLRVQRYEPGDEVIIVDNASSDDTAAVAARAAEGFPVPLLVIRESTPGKSPALNAGVAASKGDVLALTDDDVMVADDWVPTIRRLFSDPSIELVGGRVDPLWERPAPRWLRVQTNGRYGKMASPLALLHYGEAQELGARTAVGANLAMRRSVYDSLNGFAAHLGRVRGTLLCGEDHDFCQRAVAAGHRSEYRPELRVRHWVPADRARLRYYVRWFFWSGVTNAILTTDASSGREAVVPRYLVRRVLMAPLCGGWYLAAGRIPDAAAQLFDAAFALGYIGQNIRSRRQAGRAAPALAHKA